MIDLKDLTLVCADTRNHTLALRALRQSMSGCAFGRVLFFSDRTFSEPGIECRTIAPLGSAADYSQLLVKDLLPHIATSHLLVVQWDGFVLHPEAWRAEFLECDYIGARWPWLPPGSDVGNGGFSLRSRKLLEALQDPAISDFAIEDEAICQRYRALLESRHGIRFAHAGMADAFSFEAAAPPGPTFGFHGLYNFWQAIADDALAEILAGLSTANLASPQLRVLGVNYLSLGKRNLAAMIFQSMLANGKSNPEIERLLKYAQGQSTAPLAGRNDPCPCGSGRRYKSCHGALSAAMAQAAVARPEAGGTAVPDLAAALRMHEAGNIDGAERAYRALLAATPDHPVATHFLGVAAMQRKDIQAALPLLSRAAELLPEEANFHNNLGLALMEADRIEEAIACYERTLQLDPRSAMAWSNLGLARQGLLDIEGAIEAFQAALAIDAKFDRAHWNLSYALLLSGRLTEGWREYEWRLAIRELAGNVASVPGKRWNGEARHGLRLLVQAEQGLGDTLQFVRYLPQLASQGIEVTLECPAALHGVLGSLSPAVQLIEPGAIRPPYNTHIPLPSLPFVFGTTMDNIPAPAPYLRAEASRVAVWRERLAAMGGGRKIGIAWGGNPDNRYDRFRSCPLPYWEPIARLPGIQLVSMQTGGRRAELAQLPEAMRPFDCAEDMTSTAALIEALDLVISVDSALAHLAGALGKPVWVLLPFSPDWRWLLDREDSPWYPTARLFRQRQRGNWSGVVETVCRALADQFPAPQAR